MSNSGKNVAIGVAWVTGIYCAILFIAPWIYNFFEWYYKFVNGVFK